MKKFLAEFLATFGLVFAGTGAIVINEQAKGAITHAGVAITFGLVVMAMIYTFGERSGAHMNPAVTIAFSMHKVFPAALILPYILAQVGGAVVASVTINGLFPQSVNLGATIPAGTDLQSFFLEIILSFFLMMTILSVSEGGKEKGLFAGLAIGAVVLLEAMFAGPVSGASMNPARSFGPALVSGKIESIWIYILGPVAGTLAAVPVHRLIR
jgi:aquaporin Z